MYCYMCARRFQQLVTAHVVIDHLENVLAILTSNVQL